MLRQLILPVSVAISTLAAAGTRLPSTPQAAAERFVALSNSASLQTPEGKALLAGELEKFTADGGGHVPAPDAVVSVGPHKAVARLPASRGKHPDIYIYLSRSAAGWQVTSIRALALTGVLEELVRLDAAATVRSEEQARAVRNARLVLSSDAELKQWAAQHAGFLDRARRLPLDPVNSAELVELGGNDIRRDGDIVRVVIGGILDNEVGFLYAQDGLVPPLSENGYIWIEPVGGGWHLFRTT
jgi:hypothetical protein